jgi:hypothetical protein
MEPTTVRPLQELLDQSRASDAFKKAVRDLAEGRRSPQIRTNRGAPTIKVLRFLQKLLEIYPDEAITEVEINGRSGCSEFHGEAVVYPSGRRIRFWWDCSWKAEQEGMSTWWGSPDQTKAAQVFGYQCFREFTEIDRPA